MADPPAPQTDHDPSGSINDDTKRASRSAIEEATTKDPQVNHFNSYWEAETKTNKKLKCMSK